MNATRETEDLPSKAKQQEPVSALVRNKQPAPAAPAAAAAEGRRAKLKSEKEKEYYDKLEAKSRRGKTQDDIE